MVRDTRGRELDILGRMGRAGLAHVQVSLTTLDPHLSRAMEPRAAGPGRRLAMIRALAREGIPVGVNVAPIIPALNDHEIERLLEAAAKAGATRAGYITLRLPREVSGLFPRRQAPHDQTNRRGSRSAGGTQRRAVVRRADCRLGSHSKED